MTDTSSPVLLVCRSTDPLPSFTMHRGVGTGAPTRGAGAGAAILRLSSLQADTV